MRSVPSKTLGANLRRRRALRVALGERFWRACVADRKPGRPSLSTVDLQRIKCYCHGDDDAGFARAVAVCHVHLERDEHSPASRWYTLTLCALDESGVYPVQVRSVDVLVYRDNLFDSFAPFITSNRKSVPNAC